MHAIIQHDFKPKDYKNYNFLIVGGNAGSNYLEHVAQGSDHNDDYVQWARNYHDGLSQSGLRSDTKVFDRLMNGDNNLILRKIKHTDELSQPRTKLRIAALREGKRYLRQPRPTTFKTDIGVCWNEEDGSDSTAGPFI